MKRKINRSGTRGGKLAIRDVKNLLNASYKKKQDNVGDYIIDKDLSNKKVQVYKKQNDNQAVVVHRGTNDLSDWMTNLKMTFGYKKDDRFKNSKNIQKKAQEKYGAENITTLGHSLGAKLAEQFGDKSKEVITLNKPTLPLDLINKKKVKDNQVDIRTKRDPVSILQPFQKGAEDIVIPSTTNNPIKEHTVNVLDRLDQDMMIGIGLRSWKRPVGRPKRQDKSGIRYPIKLISIEPSTRKNKRFVATFLMDDDKYKKVHFGQKDPKYGTYIDHKDNTKRKNYIARHIKLEGAYIDNPITPSSLSMFILWGPYPDIQKNIQGFKKMFNV